MSSRVRKFLDGAYDKQLYLGPCIQIDLADMKIRLKGHPLSDTVFIATSKSQNITVIPIEFSREKVIRTVDYFYHMATCV